MCCWCGGCVAVSVLLVWRVCCVLCGVEGVLLLVCCWCGGCVAVSVLLVWRVCCVLLVWRVCCC